MSNPRSISNGILAGLVAGLFFAFFLLMQGSRYLVKDFGTSKSPKSTRQRAKYFGRDCPASGTLR